MPKDPPHFSRALMAAGAGVFPDRATLQLLESLRDTPYGLASQLGLASAAIHRLHLGMPGIDDALRHFTEMHAQIDQIGAPFRALAAENQRTLDEITARLQTAVNPFEHLKADASWLTTLDASTHRFQALSSALEASIARTLDLSASSARLLDTLDPGHIGLAIGIDRYSHKLEASLRAMTSSYADLASTMTAYEPLTIPRFTFEQPPVDLFLHAKVVHSISTTPSAEPPEDHEELLTSLRTEGEARLAARLQGLGSDFYRKWRGAREALASRNPDRIAHASASIRELFRLVLHTLAPDDAVRAWSSSPQDFHNGRPTRRARFDYIAGRFKTATISSFLSVDIKATLELVTLFDKGVHEKEVSFTDDQLLFLLLRMDAALSFLFDLAEHAKD